MRRILLVLIGLACAIPVAEAAPRDGRQGQAAGRTTQQAAQAARPQTTQRQAARPQTTRQQASRQQASRRGAVLRPGDVRTQRDSLVVRGAAAARVPGNAVANNCTRRNGRMNCAPARSSIAGWQRGLPVATNAQSECPSGTFATLARGHDDVVRCMPL